MRLLSQWRGFQNASTRHAISFGRLRAKRRARCGGVDRVATTLPRAICDRRRSSSFGGTRQYICHGVRRVDVDVIENVVHALRVLREESPNGVYVSVNCRPSNFVRQDHSDKCGSRVSATSIS